VSDKKAKKGKGKSDDDKKSKDDDKKSKKDKSDKKAKKGDDGPPTFLPSSIGIGLLASLVVGFGPLRDAVGGHGPFEAAMLRYLACLVACLVGASIVGRLVDGAPPPEAASPADQPDVDALGSGGSQTGAAGVPTSAEADPATEPGVEQGTGAAGDPVETDRSPDAVSNPTQVGR
jgi:hypothetical protein